MLSRVVQGGGGDEVELLVLSDVGRSPTGVWSGDLYPDLQSGAAQVTGMPWDGVARAEPNINRRIREAHQEGRQEGEAAACAQAAAEVQQALERTAHAIDELAQLRPRLRRKAEADLVALAVAIARRILHRELAIDPEALQGVIRVALDKLQSQECHRVRVHPAQEGMIRAALERANAKGNIEVKVDPSMETGGIVFETDRGNLDASIGAQLREIERGLADRLNRGIQ